MANNSLRFVVEVAADQATGALNAISTAVNQAGIRMKATMLGVGDASRAAATQSTALETRLRSLKTELVQGDRTINYFVGSLNAIVPEATAAGQGLRLLADGIVGGVGLGFAIQAGMSLVQLFTTSLRENAEAEKRAREETERHVEALNKLAYQSAIARMRASYEAAGGNPARIDRAATRLERESEIQDHQNYLLSRRDAILGSIAAKQAALDALAEKKAIGMFEPGDEAYRLKIEQQILDLRGQAEDVTRKLGEAEKALGDARAAGSISEATIVKNDIAKEREKEAKATKNLVETLDEMVERRRRLYEIDVAEEARKGNYSAAKPDFYAVKPETEIIPAGSKADEEQAKRVADARRFGQAIGNAYVQPMVSTFSQGLAMMLQGQMTFRDMMRSIWQTILNLIINSIGQMVATWITSKITEKMVDQASSMAKVSHAAGVAGANAYASQAGIPFVGPAMGAAAMATAVATILGSMMPLASARAGWDVPNLAGDIPAVVHRREMVLPEEHADTIRNLKNGGGQTINLYGTVIDERSTRRFVTSEEFQRASRRATRRRG